MARSTIGERIYRRLLRLYPRDFSDEYAGEMTRLYRDRVRDEGPASVWLGLASDLVRTAPSEQISTLVGDARHAWRTWRRTPVLALAAILTLALGVGANTAVFSVVHGVLLRPLPYPTADRLVEVFEDNSRAGGGPFFRVSLPNYLSWVERARSFDALAAFNGRDFALTDHGDPERIAGSAVTASLFKVLGVAPILGRALTEDDERPGAAPVALLAESLWVRAFGRDTGVVGHSITLNGTRHQVVGIVPASFRELGRTQIGSAGTAQIFVPLTMDTAQSRGNHTLRVVGRLGTQISLDQGRDEMQRVAARPGVGVSGHESKLERVDRATAELDVRSKGSRVAPGPAGCRRRRTPDRLRECRQSRPRPRHEPAKGTRAPRGAGCAAWPAGAAAAHRKCFACHGERCLWADARRPVDAGATRAHSSDYSSRRRDSASMARSSASGYSSRRCAACSSAWRQPSAARAQISCRRWRRTAKAPSARRAKRGGTASWSRRRDSPRCWSSWRCFCCKAWCGCSMCRSASSPAER